MSVVSIDHVAIPIQNVEGMRRFYESFGFTWDDSSAPNLYAVRLEHQKLNFHGPPLWTNKAFTLRGETASPSCGDFCFKWQGDAASVLKKCADLDIDVVEGPVGREGGAGQGTSVYVRDPDRNLVEFICY